MTSDADATVRATVRDLLRWRKHSHQRRLDHAEASADEIARYARSRTPPDLDAFCILRRPLEPAPPDLR